MSEDIEMDSGNDFYVVGIGASAGGLIALESFFKNMPSNSGLAFVVVQHLSPDFKSLMDELLARYTEMAIHKVADGIEVEANAIYLIPARNDMVMMNGRLYLNSVENSKFSPHHPIDTFLNSLAQDRGNKSIAIILSGAGSDGTKGIHEVHESGGVVLVQDEASARFSGMPHSALASGVADYVLPPEEMPKAILDYVSGFGKIDKNYDLLHEQVTSENAFSYILTLLQRKFKVDFTQYKTPTLIRRIERRMALANSKSPVDYVRMLQDDEEAELNALYRDMLVDVTHFFRDADAFSWLRDNVVPEIVGRKKPFEQLRVWVAACASGEEAYSIAILFYDEMIKQKKDLDVKIFATDVHQDSITTAANGIFSELQLKTMPPDLKSKYFTRIGEDYQIDKQVRRCIVFAVHNLLQDAVFTKLDFISCRNVLIYLLPEVQKKVLVRFHFGLLPDGVLFLGPSEHLGALVDEFAPLNRPWRIFAKTSDRRLIDNDMFKSYRNVHLPTVSIKHKSLSYREGWEKPLIDLFVPDSLLVNQHLQLVQTFGQASRFLQFPSGKVDLVVTRLVHESLVTPIRAALHRARQEKQMISFASIPVQLSNDEVVVDLKIIPVFEGNEKNEPAPNYLIRFQEVQNIHNSGDGRDDEDTVLTEIDLEHIAELEQELTYTRENLQKTIEELETTNEELQASNEELLAANEELQSTNEELHSVNEELYTVNSEYQQKNNELTQLHDDIQNLQRSSQVLTIFLDSQLRIRDFTPAVGDLFEFLPHDIGRPFTHLLSILKIDEESFHELTTQALEGDLNETAVQIRTGNKLFMQVMPYRTDEQEIEGVVLQFTDLTALRSLSHHFE